MTSMMKYAVTVMYIGNFKDIVPKKRQNISKNFYINCILKCQCFELTALNKMYY